MMAVVLGGGAGRRMRAPDPTAGLSPGQRDAADCGAKLLMPMGEGAPRPFLDFVLSSLADAGCTGVCLVVPPEHDVVRARYAPDRCARVPVHFAVQPAPTGTATAVLAAEPIVRGRPFLVVNGDNLYPGAAVSALIALDGGGLAAFPRASLWHESGFDAARVARFAVATVDGGGWLTGIDEKPPLAAVVAMAPEALVSMNLWRFDASIFAACRDVPQSPRGEFELTQAVALAVARGARLRVVVASGAVLDLTSRADIAGVSATLGLVETRL